MFKKIGLRAVVLWALLALAFAHPGWPSNFFAPSGVAEENGKIILSGAGSRLEIQFLESAAVQVELFADKLNSSFETNMTVPGALKPGAFKLEASAGEISGDKILVRYRLNPFSLQFLERGGKSLLTLAENGLAWDDDGSFAVAFQKEKGGRYFGLGEPFANFEMFNGRGLFAYATRPAHLNRDGNIISIWNKHRPPSEMGLPFLVSPMGYGLMIDNPWKASFDLSHPDKFIYSAGGGPVRFYVFAGTMYEILDAYSRLTGRPAMPPRWVTGYLQSRYGYASGDEFLWLMDNFRTRQIPCDGLIFDLDWYRCDSSRNGICMGELKWSARNFPQAAELQKELHSRGFKSITIIEPQIWKSSSNFKVVGDLGIVAKNHAGEPYLFKHWGTADALLVDFLNPAGREWFSARVKQIHESGVDGWWTDLNEPEDDHLDMIFSGQRDAAAHNTQALLEHKALFEMYQKYFPDERLFIISRAGFIGDWRYGAGIWSGDINCSWSHLKNQVPIGISSSLSGWGLWNSDVGGFHGIPSPELYTRWMQFGAFCPIYRAHGDHSLREPFSFGEQAERNLKKIMNLRYRLSPYLYTNFYEMRTSGKPVMRAMFLEFPEDEDSYKQESQYMYGPWLLVAPVTREKARSRQVYLPAGQWTDFWTEKIVSGPGEIRAEAPLDRIPLFAREGAIIPMAPLMQYMGEKPVNPLTLAIYPGQRPTSYEIYDDDGKSNAYLQGEYAITRVEFIPGETMEVKVSAQGAFKGKPEKQSFLIAVHHVSRPDQVRLGKTLLPESAQDLPANSSFCYDADKAIARIFVSEGTEFTLSIVAGPAR